MTITDDPDWGRLGPVDCGGCDGRGRRPVDCCACALVAELLRRGVRAADADSATSDAHSSVLSVSREINFLCGMVKGFITCLRFGVRGLRMPQAVRHTTIAGAIRNRTAKQKWPDVTQGGARNLHDTGTLRQTPVAGGSGTGRLSPARADTRAGRGTTTQRLRSLGVELPLDR